MATIDIKLKSYDELTFEIAKLNTDKYLLQQENKQLKEEIEELKQAKLITIDYQDLEQRNKYLNNILTELERALKDHKEIKEKTNTKEYYIEVDEVLDKIQKLKEKYK